MNIGVYISLNIHSGKLCKWLWFIFTTGWGKQGAQEKVAERWAISPSRYLVALFTLHSWYCCCCCCCCYCYCAFQGFIVAFLLLTYVDRYFLPPSFPSLFSTTFTDTDVHPVRYTLWQSDLPYYLFNLVHFDRYFLPDRVTYTIFNYIYRGCSPIWCIFSP